MKRQEVIFHQGKYFTILFFFLLSCNKSKIQKQFSIDYAKIYYKLNFGSYSSIYKYASDTIIEWRKRSIDRFGYFLDGSYQLDSALVFNKDSTRLYGSINHIGLRSNASQDGSTEFYGARIKGHWYFLTGAGLAIPRVFYQDSMYAPMTFSELSYVAHVNFIQNYLNKDSSGNFYGDDEKINKNILNTNGWGCYNCTTKEQNDSLFLAKVYENNLKRIPEKEIDRIIVEAAATRRPLEPPIDPKTGHGRTAWSTNDPKEIKFNEKVYYPEDTLDGPHPFYRKRNFIQKWLNPFQPRIFGRKNEDDPWK